MSESDKVLEVLVDFANAVESACVQLKRYIAELKGLEPKAKLSEVAFNILKWQDEKGSRLGDYQVAYAKYNLPDSWHHAFNILKANNSLIANPFHEEGYEFRYWIYPEKYSDRIFRKRINEKEATETKG